MGQDLASMTRGGDGHDDDAGRAQQAVAAAAAAATAAAAEAVYRAVAAGESAEEVRRVIELYAQGDAQRRAEVVNQEAQNNETPLQAAHRQQRGDLVGALVEAGADVGELFRWDCDPGGASFALCIAYGQVDAVRALLKAGYDPDQVLPFHAGCSFRCYHGRHNDRCRLAHLCIAPLRRSHVYPCPPPDLKCLEVIVREGGADVNARALHGETPLDWLADFVPGGTDEHRAALELLLDLGADVSAKDARNRTPLFSYAAKGNFEAVERLLARGASADVLDSDRGTPLMEACSAAALAGPGQRETALLLLRRSSAETRRAARFAGERSGWSAVDFLVFAREWLGYEPWHWQMLCELTAAGATAQPHSAADLLPTAASLGELQEDELAAWRVVGSDWRTHEEFVGLAFDAGDLRAAEREVEARRARLAALEREVGGWGSGGEESESESDSDDESD